MTPLRGQDVYSANHSFEAPGDANHARLRGGHLQPGSDRAIDPAVDRNGLQVLDRVRCLELLATARFGRLAYVSAGAPKIIPLNLVLEDEAVLFRLSTGGALAAIEARQLVSIEVDEFDLQRCCGWSVVILGIATELRGHPASRSDQFLHSWIRGTVGRVFKLPTDHIEGRRQLTPFTT